mmetsp:Transcript_6195/g.15185  ORF Transcript_6195/g.15185 Transcript_6195/m.15185 type:complete len:366 (+) Transcript_6195:160-1257(+)
MQSVPQHDSWGGEAVAVPPPVTIFAPGAGALPKSGCGGGGDGLVDIGKGKGKYGGGYKSGNDWDSWGSGTDFSTNSTQGGYGKKGDFGNGKGGKTGGYGGKPGGKPGPTLIVPPNTVAPPGAKGAGFTQPGGFGAPGTKGSTPAPLNARFQPAPRLAAPGTKGPSGKGETGKAPFLVPGGRGVVPPPPGAPGAGGGLLMPASGQTPPHPGGPPGGLDPRTTASSLGSALAAVAGAAARGAFRPPPAPAPPGPGGFGTGPCGATGGLRPSMMQQPPPPTGPAPLALLGQPSPPATLARFQPPGKGGGLVPQGFPGMAPPPPAGLAPDLAALVSAAEADDGPAEGKVTLAPPEKKTEDLPSRHPHGS